LKDHNMNVIANHSMLVSNVKTSLPPSNGCCTLCKEKLVMYPLSTNLKLCALHK
jgi:hypothetical protein